MVDLELTCTRGFLRSIPPQESLELGQTPGDSHTWHLPYMVTHNTPIFSNRAGSCCARAQVASSAPRRRRSASGRPHHAPRPAHPPPQPPGRLPWPPRAPASRPFRPPPTAASRGRCAALPPLLRGWDGRWRRGAAPIRTPLARSAVTSRRTCLGSQPGAAAARAGTAPARAARCRVRVSRGTANRGFAVGVWGSQGLGRSPSGVWGGAPAGSGAEPQQGAGRSPAKKILGFFASNSMD